MDEKLITAAERIENNHITGDMAVGEKRCLVGAVAEQYVTQEMLDLFRDKYPALASGDQSSILNAIANWMCTKSIGREAQPMTVDAATIEGFRRSLQRVAKVLPNMDKLPFIRNGEPYSDPVDGTPVFCEPEEHTNQCTAQIMHYNDNHCRGGVDAAKILREAAEVEL